MIIDFFLFIILDINCYNTDSRFFSNDSSARGGFNITYQESCGGSYILSGKLVSPHFPNVAGNFECIYTISQPERAFNKLKIDHFDLGQWEDGCNSSYLEVRDGSSETSSPIGRYCGNLSDLNSSLASTQSKIWLK